MQAVGCQHHVNVLVFDLVLFGVDILRSAAAA
jgi:hypothetical protein